MNDSKSWTKSKTILFNIAIALLTVLTSESETLRGLLSGGGYVMLMLFLAGANAYLRIITTTAIATKKQV